MAVKQQTHLEGFIRAYDMLPGGIQYDVRDEIIKSCGWSCESKSLSTFHNKRRGATPISRLEAKELKRVFKKYNIDVETGNYLN